MELTTKLKLDVILQTANLATKLTAKELAEIGVQVSKDFETDLRSRDAWDKRNEEAMKLALQIKEAKSFPWPNASNVKFPLITIAALQYHARAYPVLVGSDGPVKCKIVGQDPDGQKAARGLRVENHMSYQVMEEDEDWESEMDKVLITQPILGSAFKKSYFDPIKKHNISEYILAKDFVVNYWTKSLETAPRISQVLYMSSNDIYERVARELWLPLDIDSQPGEKIQTGLGKVKDLSQGMQVPDTLDESTPYEFIEHHHYLDLDGDGYAEPYITYIRRDTKQVVRIVARFFEEGIQRNKKNKILSIKAEQYFTKYPFIPSPDGGFYDLGFGVLLGPLNDSINTLINQLIDAGTMATLAGGFLSRGVKIRGGNMSFAPLEWKHVESTGDDLKKGIMPLPVREPSQVLFTLLELLINYGERIGGSVDVLSGVSPGQNTPAETSRNSVEQGMKIFSGIFKRTYRAMRDEFRKLYRLNQLYITETQYFTDSKDNSGVVLEKDYAGDASAIRPSADPHVISDSQRLQQAVAIKEASISTNGYDKYQVELMYLRALKVPNIEQLFPDPKGPNAQQPLPNPKVQLEQAKGQNKQAELKAKMQQTIMEIMADVEKKKAEVLNLEAQALLATAQADGIDKGHDIALLELKIAAAKAGQEGALKYMDLMQQAKEALAPPEQAQPKQGA